MLAAIALLLSTTAYSDTCSVFVYGKLTLRENVKSEDECKSLMVNYVSLEDIRPDARYFYVFESPCTVANPSGACYSRKSMQGYLP